MKLKNGIILSLLPIMLLTGCSNTNSTSSSRSKKPTHSSLVSQKATKFKNSPSKENYLSLLKTAYGSKHIDKFKKSNNNYWAVNFKGLRFKNDTPYVKFAKDTSKIILATKRSRNFSGSGLMFIQQQNKSTNFVFSYSNTSIGKYEQDDDLSMDPDSVIHQSTSFYVDPLFQDKNEGLTTNSVLKKGPIDSNHMTLNSVAMETFDN
ncbi:hypothetical protein [Levilactobacillus brevis]|uniref:hypothetical protein n=1 Tax=Levilactobacillus brevis TaxID=1580 RepID=UPI0005804CA7|nr:hypothetical protein [Levilactobacillus brevis]